MAGSEQSLPKAPKELCFSEFDFIQDDFDVDTFLQEHRKDTKLETMQADSGLYLKLLRAAMIDLINRDYTAFVDLSSNLIGMDKAIGDLYTPLGQLREEVMQVREVLDDEISAISNNLNENIRIRQHKKSLHSLQHIYKSLSKLASLLCEKTFIESPVKIDVLEQSAAELHRLKFHLSRCKLDIAVEKQKEARKYEETYTRYLDEFFLSCVHEKNEILTIRCLRIYVMLDKVFEVEALLRTEVISPLIRNVISAEDAHIDHLGLQSMYNKLLNILHNELKQLLDITLHPERASVKGFNFLVNSFWVEVEDKIEQYTKRIFAPWDPDLFHNRYTATLDFLKKLEAECVTPESLHTLRENPQYKNILKKWNLPVYFQIRFQEIAGAVEVVLMEPIAPGSIKGTIETLVQREFSLCAYSFVWENIPKMWAEDVYLDQLFQRFWKFTLQMCARLQRWSEDALKKVWPVENEITNTSKTEYSTRLNFLIYLYKDVEKFVNILPSILELVRSKLKEENSKIYKLLDESLQETEKCFKNISPRITDEIVTELLKQCATHLKQVSDIPRLFRRTNRDVPTKPCTYVKNALAFLTGFHNEYTKIIPEDVNQWLKLALASLTEHYLTSVTDVLTSVQKTEESLRRLKKIRDKSIGSLPAEAQGVSDDEKIRIQLQVDVHAYTAMIEKLDVPTFNVPHLEELLHAVETAIKK